MSFVKDVLEDIPPVIWIQTTSTIFDGVIANSVIQNMPYENLNLLSKLIPKFYIQLLISTTTRCTRGLRVVFSVTRMRSSNSARMKFDFTTEKIDSAHVNMTVFEIVAHHNVDHWIQLLT